MYLSKVKIREAMSRQGIKNFTELSHQLNITKNQLSVMLSDNYNPLKARIEQLCQLLNVAPNEIMDFPVNNIITIMPQKLEPSTNANPVTAIELFAGAGGLALGLELAKIKTVEYVEIDKACCETLRTNRPDWNVICDSIYNIDFSHYQDKIDIVTGGFPCQAFSYAGKKLGFEDTRGTLFHEFARCIAEVKPKIFMAENVKGLQSHDNGRTLETIINVFESLGYQTQKAVLNAAYFGVGQKRQRIVIIGIRNDLEIDFEYPVPDVKMTNLREALYGCPPSPGVEYSERKKKVFELVPPGGCWVNLPVDVAKDYMGKSYFSGGGRRGMARRISWDEPCLTLTCSPSQKQTDRCHPEETRPFTVREYARIQSFPDDWKFCGGIGDQYKQIGNAVPVKLAERIGIKLREAIINYRKKNHLF